jgi:hypothetical protein
LLGVLDKKVHGLASTIQTIYNNQVKLETSLQLLGKSERLLDHQVAVLTRITISNLNSIRVKMGDDFLSEEEIAKVFDDWAAFYARGDSKKHMTHWVLGKPIEDLPPPPEPPKEEAKEEAEEAQASEETEGPTVFGGDYAESENGDETAGEVGSTDGEDSEKDEVPGVRTSDAPIDQGASDGPAVPSVSP